MEFTHDASTRPEAQRSVFDNNAFGWHESWNVMLNPLTTEISKILVSLGGTEYFPNQENIFAALRLPFSQVKVVLIGQDPYPSPGMAEGLAFSVPSSVSSLPPSLRNIFREYESDLKFPQPTNGHLGRWVENGVLLLNRYLTVQPGSPLSHKNLGWVRITDSILTGVASRFVPVICWGKDAHEAAKKNNFVNEGIFASPHPSPLSAYRGFFGSRPFSRINNFLVTRGSDPIDWRLP